MLEFLFDEAITSTCQRTLLCTPVHSNLYHCCGGQGVVVYYIGNIEDKLWGSQLHQVSLPPLPWTAHRSLLELHRCYVQVPTQVYLSPIDPYCSTTGPSQQGTKAIIALCAAAFSNECGHFFLVSRERD